MKRLSSLIILFLLIPTLCFGAFPTTGILDNFNRANSPSLGADWTQYIGTAGISSNQFYLGADYDTEIALWNHGNFGPDTELYITIATHYSDEVAFYIRDDGADNSYKVYFNTATNIIQIFRIDDGDSTQLGSTVNQTISNGDGLGVEMIGSTIKSYYKASGGSWVAKDTQSDSTYSNAGEMLIKTYTDATATFRLDDFGGGTVVSGGAAPRQGQIVWIE
jgi:hypothetical protein